MAEQEKGKHVDLDETLYAARRVRAGLSVLQSMDEDISEFGYHELLRVAWLFCDQQKSFIKELDGIIEDLMGVGAEDYATPHQKGQG